MVTDSIANCLTMIRNSLHARRAHVTIPSSKVVESVLTILHQKGFIDNFKTFQDGSKKFVRVHLKYESPNKPAIRNVRRISKSSLRVYAGAGDIPHVLNGMGIAIVSTSKGIMSDDEARKNHVGGEVLCEVW
ncbi:MAG: 30S ribosomal protein S8 [Candidatus Omnitrophica bacterium]|nr:30S ribosomal protein S8 [Candidatus Omnitrophota bacterium]